MVPLPRRRRRGFVLGLAAVTTVATVALLAATVVSANFAPGLLWTLLMLAVPLTVGLPTTLGVLACVCVFDGPPLWLFGFACAAVGFALQAPAMLIASRLRTRRDG